MKTIAGRKGNFQKHQTRKGLLEKMQAFHNAFERGGGTMAIGGPVGQGKRGVKRNQSALRKNGKLLS